MIAPGEFVLDFDAQHGDESGSAEEVGVRGLVYAVTPWRDDATGEIGDVLSVATSHHAQLRTATLKDTDVAVHCRASRIDAARYKTLATRQIGKDGRNVKPWIVQVLTVAEGCMHDAPDRRDVPSIFPTTDEVDQWAADHPDEAAGFQLRTLQDRLAADTARRRTERSTA